MTDDSAALRASFDEGESAVAVTEETASAPVSKAGNVPQYLQETYWWAYLHPSAVRFWEHEWLVNGILWGQMDRLTATVIDELDLSRQSNLLQIACVYGGFSGKLGGHAARSDSRLHILDIAPIQIANARRKLAGHRNVSYHLGDSSDMQFPDTSFDHSVLYFLLHEQPEDVRKKTLAEALRVTRPGGKVVVVDYHRPRMWNGLRAIMWPVLKTLEPFALDLWRHTIEHWLPAGDWRVASSFYCGGLYQKTVIHKKS